MKDRLLTSAGTTETARLIADAAWEMESVLSEWGLTLNLDVTTVMALTTALQIALRDPKFKRRPSAKLVAQLVEHLIGQIPPSAPATKRIAELAAKPEFDYWHA